MMLTLRVWATSNTALAAAGAAAFVAAAIVATVALARIHGMPVVNVALLILIPLSLAGFLAGPQRRPVTVRAVTVPVAAARTAPGARAPAVCGPRAPHYSRPAFLRGGAGRARRPAAALAPPPAAAGPAYRIGRATVPIGGTR